MIAHSENLPSSHDQHNFVKFKFSALLIPCETGMTVFKPTTLKILYAHHLTDINYLLKLTPQPVIIIEVRIKVTTHFSNLVKKVVKHIFLIFIITLKSNAHNNGSIIIFL